MPSVAQAVFEGVKAIGGGALLRIAGRQSLGEKGRGKVSVAPPASASGAARVPQVHAKPGRPHVPPGRGAQLPRCE